MKTLTHLLCAIFILASLATAPAAESLFTDSFSGANGGRPEQWTFDTTNTEFWTVQNGWLASGAGSDLVTVDGYSFAVIDTPGAEKWENYKISCRFRMNKNSGKVLLVGRWTDRDNHYRASLNVFAGQVMLKIVKRVYGKTTELKSKIVEPKSLGLPAVANTPEGSSIDFSLSFHATTISAGLGGQTILFAKDPDLTHGTAGVGQSLTNVVFDDVTVAPLSQTLPPDASAGQTGAQGGSGAYSVQLMVTEDASEAQSLADSLNMQGYFPTVQERNGNYVVRIGRFATKNEADKMRLLMANEGFAFAKVASVSGGGETAPASGRGQQTTLPEAMANESIPREVLQSPDLDALTPAQREELVDVMLKERAARMEMQSVQQILDLKQQVQELSKQQNELLTKINQQEAERQQRQETVSKLTDAIEQQVRENDYAGAMATLKQLQDADPNNPIAARLRDKIEYLQSGTWPGYQNYVRMQQQTVDTLQQEAQRAEQQGNMQAARTYWMSVMAQRPGDQELVQKARQKIQSLSNRMQQQEQQTQSEKEDQQMMVLYIAAGVAGFLLLLLILLWIGGRRRYTRLQQQVEEEAITPIQMMQSRGGPTPAAAGAAAGAGAGFGAETSGEGFGGGFGGGETYEPPTTEAGEDEEDLVMDFGEAEEEEEEPSVLPPSTDREEVEDIVLSFDENEQQEGEDENPNEGGGGGGPGETVEEESPEEIVFSFEPEEEEEKGDEDEKGGGNAENPLDESLEDFSLTGAEAGEAGISQDFNDEAVGGMPKGWEGEATDYASLTVAEDDQGGGNCLCFRKNEGSGPTDFSRTFEPVRGRVVVEYDIRCDEKNKHLLGVYVEEDADFRRAVHTVVQYVDPSEGAHLRIFTKATPYELGSWRHVKYMIDLNEGLVNGYVDGELVADSVPMGTKAEKLNTVTIRDNSESTGTLCLNNLQIYEGNEE